MCHISIQEIMDAQMTGSRSFNSHPECNSLELSYGYRPHCDPGYDFRDPMVIRFISYDTEHLTCKFPFYAPPSGVLDIEIYCGAQLFIVDDHGLKVVVNDAAHLCRGSY